jgi:glycerophosphoryl diester phosphodiesterase
MAALDWLIARPVAHRGLHDLARGVIENTPSAFAAAVMGNYAIECDLQLSRDGEAMVHHDDALGRLIEGSGRLDAMTAEELKRAPFRNTADRMITLDELCHLVAGRVPLVIELKSRFDGDLRLVDRTAQILARYAGPAAVMSFDPAQIVAMREIAPQLPRGLVAQRRYRGPQQDSAAAETRRALAYLRQGVQSRPQFVAYAVKDLPATLPLAAHLLGLPVLTWTVRTEEDRQRAARWADQMIFEGFRP